MVFVVGVACACRCRLPFVWLMIECSLTMTPAPFCNLLLLVVATPGFEWEPSSRAVNPLAQKGPTIGGPVTFGMGWDARVEICSVRDGGLVSSWCIAVLIGDEEAFGDPACGGGEDNTSEEKGSGEGCCALPS